MKKAIWCVVLVLTCASLGMAGEPVTAVVIDSGSDFTHPLLAPLARPNLAELRGKPGIDDDGNGYVDDVYGWNFPDNSPVLVDLTKTPPAYDRVIETLRLLNILQAYGKEALKPEEFQTLLKNYQDQQFWPWVEFTGGWAHGTHCAGILSTENPGVRLNAITHLPAGQAPEQMAQAAIAQIRHRRLHARPRRPFATRASRVAARPAAAPDAAAPAAAEPVSLAELSLLFTQLGYDYAAKIKKEAAYLGALAPRVANCSFGSENAALLAVFKQTMVEEWGWTNPTDQEVQQVVNLFVEKVLLVRDKALFAGSPKTLYCIAAGNSGDCLEGIVVSPNDVDIPNKLVVAATLENKKLADFSCYGKTKVDVAVPGVNIYATFPNNKMGYMSGTSMACPMAARFATQVLQEHPGLSAIEVKKILMGTVDKKDWLADKVVSGGVVNPRRAVHAAGLVKQGKSLDEAIAEARQAVPDMTIRRSPYKGPDLSDKLIRDLYFSAVF